MAASSSKILNLVVVLVLVGIVLIAAGEVRPLVNVTEEESSMNRVEGVCEGWIECSRGYFPFGIDQGLGAEPRRWWPLGVILIMAYEIMVMCIRGIVYALSE